ncbi:hypothetical protein [Flavobacterium sp.]|uniref:hypothetical protein n=1 Tax=Flavobacterium sp. TaxID=239 RepID=UPI003F696878
MILFIDKLEKFELGGFTTNIRKAEYILAVHGLTFESILSTIPKSTKTPFGMFASGKFIVTFNIQWDLKYVNIGFINYETDLDKNFDVFADTFSPKSVAGFYKLQTELKEKVKNNEINLDKIELSDDNLDFEIAYENYIEHKNRQLK